MPFTNNFDPLYLLSEKTGGITRDEAVRLGKEVCGIITELSPEGGYHGGIFPDNISLAPNCSVGVGPVIRLSKDEMSPDALEYISPELFWEGTRSARSDVYSLGLVLYSALSGGRLPFAPETGEVSPSDRAKALRRRMQGEDIPSPKNCDDTLAAVILKALSPAPEERYADLAEFSRALEECDGPSAVAAAAAAAGASAAMAEAPKYTVDKNFEPMEEDKKKEKKKPGKPVVIAVTAVAACVLALLLLLKSCAPGEEPPAGTPTPTLPSETALIPETDDPTPAVSDAPESPDVTTPASPDITPTTPVQTPETTPTPTPAVTPTATPAVTPTPTVIPSPIPVAGKSVVNGNYTMVLDNCTWAEARVRCEEMGGHLATITDQADLNRVIAMANELGAKYIWLGAQRSSSGNMEWVTGENISFYPWDLNEPSYADGYDGTPENYLMLWYVTFGQHKGWAYNDSRMDPVSAAPSVYGGKIAFICEFD